MSDSLFEREKHLNLYKPRVKGILQFSKMTVDMMDKEAMEAQRQELRRLRKQAKNGVKLVELGKTKEEIERYMQRPIVVPNIEKLLGRENERHNELPVHMQVWNTFG